MSKIFYESTEDAYTEADAKAGRGRNAEVTEQHPLPVQVTWKSEGQNEFAGADEAAGLPVQQVGTARVTSVLVETPWTEVPGIVIANQPSDAGDALGTMGMNDKDINGSPLPRLGYIIAAKLLDPDDDTLAATVHVFSRPLLTGQTDDGALAISIADARNWITSIGFPVTTDVGTTKVAETLDIDSPFSLPNGVLYWQFSTAGAPSVLASTLPLVKFFILPQVRL